MPFRFLWVIFSLWVNFSFGQQNWWIFFRDKGLESSTYYKNSASFLSPTSLQRRLNQGISITEKDLPVSSFYVEQLKNIGLPVVMTSRWLNAAVVSIQPTEFQLSKLPFVSNVLPCKRYVKLSNTAFQPEIASKSQQTDNQLNMIGLKSFQSQGFLGSGVNIAVFDDGYLNVDVNFAFQKIRQDGRFIATRDFVEGDSLVTDAGTHGATVLAILAGSVNDTFAGSAPNATYWLVRTENQGTEKHIEEYNWLAAAEWADSVGIDIISSSLGYNTFDSGEGDYSLADLNGKTAIITKAAEFAASIGILVVNSAGNEGLSSWKKITVPCDGDSVLCVGAVDPAEVRWYGCSIGPTADGRIKPNVMAQGSGTATIFPNGAFGTTSGTSVATPLIAGLAACLWQANPTATNMQIFEAIQKSADRFANPDTFYGNGIPDAIKADSILKKIISYRINSNYTSKTSVFCYPNPVQKELFIQFRELNTSDKFQIELCNSTGYILWKKESNDMIFRADLSTIPAGFYWIRVSNTSGYFETIPVFKLSE
ncbi:MAG: S8 family peptidase [Bacteroidia bacterium]|nr:S8 family peptidase [Bacteroidia bacterium]